MAMTNGLYLGVDVGAAATKAVLIDGAGDVRGRALANSGADFTAAASACVQEAATNAHVPVDAITYLVSTGYGRERVENAAARVTEITCHARGCYAVYRQAMTIVDIGGQDNKVIALADDGTRQHFTMNRKCAAGTGAFLEEIAARLDTPLPELGTLARQATGHVELGSFCTVFAKTELLRLIAQGTPVPEIAKAAYRSVVQRIIEMDPLAGDVVMTGGVVAHHDIVVELVAESIGRPVRRPEHAQFAGAYGAALIARDLD